MLVCSFCCCCWLLKWKDYSIKDRLNISAKEIERKRHNWAGERVLSRISVISNAKERCTVNRIGESTWNKDEAGCKEGRGGRCSSGRSGARGGDGGSGDGDWDSGNGWGGNGGDPRDFINGQNLRHSLLLHHFVLLLLPLLAPCRHFCIRVERMPRWYVEEVRSLT